MVRVFSNARAGLAAMLCGVLAASLLAVEPAQAAPPPRPGAERLTSQVEPLDKHGREVHGRPWAPRGQRVMDTPAPVWPKAGSARVVLASRDDRRPSAAGGVRAGTLPVRVDRAGGVAGDRVSQVTVQVLDRDSAPSAWRNGVLLRVGSPDSASGAARVSVDYSGFRFAYGGEWASRLRLWQLPPCALSVPAKPGCRATLLPSHNDTTATTVSAEVPVVSLGGTGTAGTRAQLAGNEAAPPTAGTLIAVAASPSGPSGDFAATSLAASSTWSAGGSSGEFSWSYPLRVPPGLGGPRPSLSLSYSSASVDGRSEATNNQPSWLGEGFELWPGFIERRYVPCAEDMTGGNNTTKTGDLCWRSDNAVMSLNGRSSELIFESGKGWHARSEDASKIEKLTDGSNGDNNAEYWKVTTPDGVQYFFGRHNPPGHTGTTNSVNTVRVYGNHSNEPCNTTSFTTSFCNQAWRWNLDYVVDPRGNTMTLWYARERNKYAARVIDTDVVEYVRASTLDRIEYGTWDRGSTARSITPTAQVKFTVADRCLANCTIHDAAHWPDLPWDQNCDTAATSCPGLYSPTFWSTKRLTKATTKVWDTTVSTPVWQDVDSWTFGHSFPPPGDGSDHAGLWLSSITHAGHVGGTVTLPPVTFEPISLPNRVLTLSNTTNNWQRIANIVTETGARIQVSYSVPDCTMSSLPSAAHTNTRRCYPVIGPDPANPDGPLLTEYWHKYVVSQVAETDVQIPGGHQAPTKNTSYFYGGDPAWHYADDDGLTKPDRKTWNQWRGYTTVFTQVGDTQQTKTETRYLRGMHGDRAAPSGGVRSVTVPASVGSETVFDEDAFAGMVREQIVYNGVDSRPVSKTVHVPWQSPATASRTINGDTASARFANTRVTYQATALGVNAERGFRTTRSESTFDNTSGVVTQVRDDGDLAVTGDEQCAVTSYNRNTTKNLVQLPARVTTTALACGQTPASGDDMISDVRYSYDGGDPATAPQFGSVTRTEQLKDWTTDDGTVFQTVSQATYDAFGRTERTTDIRDNTTTIAYTPASGGPVTRVTSTSPLQWVSTADQLPYWANAVTRTTDPNGSLADVQFDPLGRVFRVWQPGWTKAAHPSSPSADYTYTYSASRSDYPFITARQLHAGGAYRTTHQIFDAFLRPRQAQMAAVGGGRVVSDTLYDAWGRAVTSYRPHAEPGDPSGALWWEPEWSVPALTKTEFDRANRPTAEVFYATDGVENLIEKWRSTTSYAGDMTSVTPPAGDTPTTIVTDAHDRTIELRQHTTTSGVAGAHQATRYSYNRKNQLAKVTDPAGNEWTYTFDLKGRQTETVDPDKGHTTNQYNDVDDLVATTDARGEVLAYEYDRLGRKIGLYDDTVSPATKRAEWKYDRLFTQVMMRGQLTEAIRYEPPGSANAYKRQIVDYNPRYQVVADNFVIPASEPGLAGSYNVSYKYSPFDGTPAGTTYPNSGDLPPETVTVDYEATLGLPSALETTWGIDTFTYVEDQQYSAFGEPTIITRRTAFGSYVQDANTYDLTTRRVTRTRVLPELATGTVSDRNYSYDPAGNITSIADTPQVGTADTQCFRYDRLRRLTSAWTPTAAITCATDPTLANLGGPAPYWQGWTIDAIGNRLTETSHTTGGDTTHTYTVPPSGAGMPRPHSVTAVRTDTPSGQVTTSYGYDQTGNTTSRPNPTGGQQTLTWNSEGRLAVTNDDTGGNVATNVYDGDGVRLIRRDSGGSTLFLPGTEIHYNPTTSARTATRYYSFAGRVIGSRTIADGLVWLFGDHQGTQHTSIRSGTQQAAIRRQTPYGTPRGTQPTWPNQRGFVGGDNEPTGLTHLGARDYDSQLGRFISVDPIMDLADSQQMHGYAYANNSPVTMSDPDGLDPRPWHHPDYDPEMCENSTSQECHPGEPFTVAKTTHVTVTKKVGGRTSVNGTELPSNAPSVDRWLNRLEMYLAKVKQPENNPLNLVLMFFVDLCAPLGGSGVDCDPNFHKELVGRVLPGMFRLAMQYEDGPGPRMPVRPGVRAPNRPMARCNSFLPGTLVLMADGSRRPIEKVRVGDEVIATDPDTGRTTTRKVTTTITGTGPKRLVSVTVDPDGPAGTQTAVLIATDNHLLWTTTAGWAYARDLRPGYHLTTPSGGQIPVTGQLAGPIQTTSHLTVHNLAIIDTHTYYVLAGNTPVLVHNDGGEMIGAGGTQITSKTLWLRGPYRIDVENPNPGQRPGQIHFQDQSTGAKYLYNFDNGEFDGMPNSLKKELNKNFPDYTRGITKGKSALGFTGC